MWKSLAIMRANGVTDWLGWRVGGTRRRATMSMAEQTCFRRRVHDLETTGQVWSALVGYGAGRGRGRKTLDGSQAGGSGPCCISERSSPNNSLRSRERGSRQGPDSNALGSFVGTGRPPATWRMQRTTPIVLYTKTHGIRPDQLSLSALFPGTDTQSNLPWLLPLPPPASRTLPSGELNATSRVE